MTKKDIDPNKLCITYENPDYKIINYVYKYHPFFSCACCADKMAELSKKYAISLIKNMDYIARESKKVYAKIEYLENQLDECREILIKFQEGTFTVDV